MITPTPVWVIREDTGLSCGFSRSLDLLGLLLPYCSGFAKPGRMGMGWRRSLQRHSRLGFSVGTRLAASPAARGMVQARRGQAPGYRSVRQDGRVLRK